MIWQSVQELVDDLNLNVNANDSEEVRKEIVSEIALVHPDRNGGIPESDEHKQRCTKLTEALGWLSSRTPEPNQLITVSIMRELISVISDAKTPKLQNEPHNLRREYKDDEKRIIHYRHQFPKIGSGVFAAICVALFTFSSALIDHPIFGGYAKDKVFVMNTLSLSFVAGNIFLMTWFSERRQEGRVEWLMSEQGGQELFISFMKQVKDQSDRDQSIVGIREFADFIRKEELRRESVVEEMLRRMGNHGLLSPSLAEKLAKVHFSQFVENGILKKLVEPSLDTKYQIHTGVIDTLLTVETIIH